jgi:amino acid permease
LFSFVAQHIVNLVFESLSREIRSVGNFEKVSTLSMMMATTISLVLGFFVYMTFWEDTTSAMFQLYPSSAAVDTSRILLCMSMLLTYPFPFLTVRELIILAISLRTRDDGQLEQAGPLDLRTESYEAGWLLPVPGHGRQLVFKYHVALTVSLWSITLYLALAAASLGDVLNLVGCTTGTGTQEALPSMMMCVIS